jgi:putative flippase GtrA
MITRQLGPYALIAGFCAALNITVMIAGDAVGLHYAVSTAISFILCVLVGYALHCHWTFRSAPRLDSLVRYAIAMAVNYPASLAGIWAFYDLAGLPMTIAAPLSTGATVALNFALSRWAIAQAAGARK